MGFILNTDGLKIYKKNIVFILSSSDLEPSSSGRLSGIPSVSIDNCLHLFSWQLLWEPNHIIFTRFLQPETRKNYNYIRFNSVNEKNIAFLWSPQIIKLTSIKGKYNWTFWGSLQNSVCTTYSNFGVVSLSVELRHLENLPAFTQNPLYLSCSWCQRNTRQG